MTMRIVHATGRKGQGVIEYATVLAIVIAALIAMQGYVKRGISGRLRISSDSIGEQYDPRRTTGTVTLSSTNDTTTRIRTVNEPQLATACVSEQEGLHDCRSEETPEFRAITTCDDQGDNCVTCVDVNENGQCEDRVFATVTQSILNEETVSRQGSETVGPLGTTLWN